MKKQGKLLNSETLKVKELVISNILLRYKSGYISHTEALELLDDVETEYTNNIAWEIVEAVPYMKTREELHDTIIRTHSGLNEEQWQEFNINTRYNRYPERSKKFIKDRIKNE